VVIATKKAVLLCSLLLLFLALILIKTHLSSSDAEPTPHATVAAAQSASSYSKGVQPLIFFEKDNFYEGVLYSKQHNQPFGYKVAGGVAPHHLLPSFIISNFFNRLTVQKPPTVILVGPNHYEKGDAKALSSDFGWQTPFGIVEPNQVIISDLRAKNILNIDNQVSANEHSVGGIMPYIKYYLPDTTVVPIIVKRGLGMDEINTLASSLSSYIEDGAVVVASVDFSHYLSSEEAQEKDKITLKAIQNFDYRNLLSLNNDYLDSPPSIAVLLKTMKMTGTTASDLLHHTNSGILQKNRFQPTTSYISLVFH
jgi:MEMO1 family protein